MSEAEEVLTAGTLRG